MKDYHLISADLSMKNLRKATFNIGFIGNNWYDKIPASVNWPEALEIKGFSQKMTVIFMTFVTSWLLSAKSFGQEKRKW